MASAHAAAGCGWRGTRKAREARSANYYRDGARLMLKCGRQRCGLPDQTSPELRRVLGARVSNKAAGQPRGLRYADLPVASVSIGDWAAVGREVLS